MADRILVQRETSSADATAALGAGFARLLQPGDVVALTGELGSGKTTFVRSVAAGLGVRADAVSSPTFVIVNRYPIQPDSQHASIKAVSHADAYRLQSPEDLDNAGWDRVMVGDRAAPGSVLFIEWADRLGPALPSDSARITIRATGAESRAFTFELPASWQKRPRLQRFLLETPRTCPTTGVWVAPGAPSYPFADERARGSDLFGWLTERYTIDTPINPGDDDDPPPAR